MVNENFFKEEIRNGVTVSSKMKRIWYTELNLYQEFDRFCKEFDLKYFADYGTLLGAVRHKGFIPWDDDMDFTMLRPDYQRMLELAPEYFNYPVYFQSYHTEQGPSVYNFSRIRNERTTFLGKEFTETRKDHPGIFIDIFPLDAVPSSRVINKPGGAFDIALDIWLAASDPRAILDEMIKGNTPAAGIDTMLDILGLPLIDRLTLYENILSGMYSESDYINFFPSISIMPPYKKSWYNDIVDLPFEYLTLPAPSEYDLILKTCYGNYWKPVMNASDHEAGLIDPDKPYTEYVSE